jgi:hypothetical protein
MTIPSTPAWNTFANFCFRFLFIYACFYSLPFFLQIIPYVGRHYNDAWLEPVRFTLQKIFRLTTGEIVMPNYSLDTTFNYVQLFLIFSVSLITAVIWSAVKPSIPAYERIWHWLIIILRYYIGAAMVIYGVRMAFGLEFPLPYNSQLLHTYASSTRLGLLSIFIGISPAYKIFIGAIQLGAGLMLLFRRARFVGAFLLSILMINVVVLTIIFDVPLKLHAIHLLVFSLILLAPDLMRLARLFFINTPIPSAVTVPLTAKRRLVYAIGKGVFIFLLLFFTIALSFYRYKRFGDGQTKPYLYGLHDVDIFIVNGDTLPSLLDNSPKWKSVELDTKNRCSIYYLYGGRVDYRYEIDSAKGKLVISDYDKKTFAAFDFKDDQYFIFMKGTINGDTAIVDLRKNVEKDFAITTRGFKWIHEYFVR